MISKENEKKLREEVDKIIGEDFSKHLVLKTNACYYTKDGKRFKTQGEAAQYLNIQTNDLVVVESYGGYCAAGFSKFVFYKDSEYFDILLFHITTKIKSEDRGDVSLTRITRCYKNKEMKRFYSKWLQRNSVIQEAIDDTADVASNKIRMYDLYEDVDSKYIHDFRTIHNYERKISDETQDKIVEFYKSEEPEVNINVFKSSSNTVGFVNFMRASRRESKGVQTKDALLKDVFVPILNRITWTDSNKIIFDSEVIREIKEKYGDYGVNIVKNKRKNNNCYFVRYGEWIIYTSNGDCCKSIFYNIKTKKKYMVNKTWNNNYSLCSFNMNRYTFASYTSQPNTNNLFAECYDYRLATESRFINVLYENVELGNLRHCYNIEGDVISASKCFEGTFIPSLIENFKDHSVTEDIRSTLDIYKENLPPKNYKLKEYSFGECAEMGYVDAVFFGALLVKPEYKLMAELLAKQKLYYILNYLINNQNSFAREGKEALNLFYTFAIYKRKTSLREMFSLSNKNLQIFDEFLRSYCFKKEKSWKSTPNVLSKILLLLGEESLKTIDSQTFKEYIEYFSEDNVDVEGLKDINAFNSMQRNPKEILALLKRIPDVGTWRDYLRLREQMKILSDNNPDIIFDIDKYPVLPEKSKKYVRLFDDPQNQYYHRTAETKLIGYLNKYKDASEVRENGELLGVKLNLSPSETITFLHDELSYWQRYYIDSKKEELFEGAVKENSVYEYEDEDLEIVSPRTIKDLKREAETLGHCAASFVDPIINRCTDIFFLRRKDMPNVPYYTIELKDRQIRQVHCYHNGNLDLESQNQAFVQSHIESYNKQFDIVKFLKKWAKKFSFNSDSVHTNYGALCAPRY